MQIGYRIYYRLYRPDGAGTVNGPNSTSTEQWQTKELHLHTVATDDRAEPIETVLKGLKRYGSIGIESTSTYFRVSIKRNINKFYSRIIIRFYYLLYYSTILDKLPYPIRPPNNIPNSISIKNSLKFRKLYTVPHTIIEKI